MIEMFPKFDFKDVFLAKFDHKQREDHGKINIYGKDQ